MRKKKEELVYEKRQETRNPFLNTSVVHTVKRQRFQDFSVVSKNNELYRVDEFEASRISLSYVIDKDMPVKFFQSGRRRGDWFAQMTPIGSHLFMFIVGSMGRSKDWVDLSYKLVAETWIGISRSTLYRAINELKDADIIRQRKGATAQYWVNPMVCFRGDRIKYFAEHSPDSIREVFLKKKA